ncbi:MAG: twin-arginine translocation pathway signal protein, partial [Spirosomataceae bacterium]
FLLLIFISSTAQTYQSDWQNKPDMPWVGEELWANRLQDWQIQGGTLKCNITGKNRSVALLTHKMIDSFTMEATVQFDNLTPTPGVIGFEIGRKGNVDDYRSAAIYGAGLSVGINKKGQL